MFLHFNGSAMTAYRNYNMHNQNIARCMERLSSGKRINRAADDPAGMAMSQKLRTRLTELSVDRRNAQDALSQVSVADGLMGEMQSMMRRMLELADQSANGTYSDEDRAVMDKEYQQMMDEINRIGKGSCFNGKSLFGEEQKDGTQEITGITYVGSNLDAYMNGMDDLLHQISLAAQADDNDKLLSLGVDRSNGLSDAENLKLAVENFTKNNADRLLNTPMVNGDSGSQFVVELSDGNVIIHMPTINEGTLGLSGTGLGSADGAREAAEALKEAMKKMSSWRGDMGAASNRLERTMNTISVMEENLTDALSRIEDADMAKEMMTLVKEQLLAQVSGFVMAQANKAPDKVLSLMQDL